MNIGRQQLRKNVIPAGDRVQNIANKCIGDDTKAAARQSLNCIKNKKNMAKNDFQYGGWNSYTL